jgi:hypothetical protein
MTDTSAQSVIHKEHAGLNYTIVLKPHDSSVYLDIDQLGLYHHQVKTTCAYDAWDDLEKEGDQAASTIIDLHNEAPKGLF